MKKFFKVLAIALAMILTASLAQPVSAEAAATPKLNTKKKTVYVGGSSVYAKYGKGYITLKVNNRPKSYSVSWTSSDSDVIKIEPLGKYRCTVTALMPGTAVVTAEVIDKTKTPNTKYTLASKITVKANCAAVDITPSTVDELEIGKTISLVGTMYNKSGKTLTSGVDVTDAIKWVSSDNSVATVSAKGLVTAVGVGKATITCYTVQTNSGKYSKYEKATAKDSIAITVKEDDTVIKSVSQKALDKFEILFGKDYSQAVKLDNIRLSLGSGYIELSEIKFDETGKKALVTTKNELAAKTVYTVSVTGTASKNGLTAQFTTSSGTPAALKIYSAFSNNLVIAGETTEMKFSVYDANGVDITPTDEKSSAYLTYAGRISYSANGVGSFFVLGRSVMIFEEGKSATIIGTYNDPAGNKLTAAVTLTAVSEAATMTLDGVTVTKSTKAATELDWEKIKLEISSSDYGEGYKLVARVRRSDGTYIYSDSSSTKISFSFADNYTPNAVFSDANGILRPFKSGSDTILVKYDGVILGSATVVVGGERVPAIIKIYVDGVEDTSVKLSDAYSVTNPEIRVAIFDNYGELWNYTSWSDISFSCQTTGAPIISPSGVGTDGLVNFYTFPYGSGSAAGTAYRYVVSYTNGATKLSSSFTVISYKPNEKLPTSYRVVTIGESDMVVNSSFDATNGKKLQIKLVSYKGEIRYEDNIIRKKNEASAGDYYIVIKDPAGKEISNFETGEGAAVLTIAKVNGTAIEKMKVGTYNVSVYQKGSGSSDSLKAGAQFTLTDTQEGATYEQLSTKTAFTITPTLTDNPGTVNAILAQCFNFRFAGEPAIGTVTSAISGTGSLYIQTVSVTGSVTVNGVPYQVTVPLVINKVITESK